ncbi:hypothetical protein DPMN_041540 [Dreissena polymorpha]|uniref:Uncharacterized protein n=1 Tax=Dreissena polymorpha TaxID=45954 RepID=A0A9D4CZK7_DREPO|nr:hypothetical protein DPMN_041540 [Dreissena polymorpha]
MLKLEQTNQQTDQQTGQKQYVPHYRTPGRTTNDSALACLSLKSVRICTIFDLIQDIIGTFLLTKFRYDQTINVASRVLTRKNAEPTGSHVFQPISIIFLLVQDIMASRVKIAPFLGSHVFQANITIFKIIQDIIKTNLLTKFDEDWTIRPLERSHSFTKAIYNHIRTIFNHIRKNAPPPGGHFHENLAINVASRENAPPHKCHVFQPTGVILKLVKDIIGLNFLTKFHEDRTMNVASIVINAPSLGSHVFQANTNLLTKFHEDWTKNAASRVSTMQMFTPYNARRTKDDHKSLS